MQGDSHEERAAYHSGDDSGHRVARPRRHRDDHESHYNIAWEGKMLNHKRSALSIALAVVLTPSLAAAQSTQTTATPPTGTAATNLDTVQVTGIRRGIESAIATKQDATSVVEAISAEDIGKLPDVSIAESISRLPGLAAQRVGGRAQVISVRGLSPDFATTLLNGREMVSTGD